MDQFSIDLFKISKIFYLKKYFTVGNPNKKFHLKMCITFKWHGWVGLYFSKIPYP